VPGKRETKREDLRARLVAAARARIAAMGLAGLRARDVTADAGCALGALYTVFDDLDGLIFAVNAMTLEELGRNLHERLSKEADGATRLKLLGAAYLAFARAQPGLWRALFDHHVPDDKPVPDWQIEHQAALLKQIAGPLRHLLPGLDETALLARARTLFAAVHGIVSISLENRFVGISAQALDEELDRFIDLLLIGLKERRRGRQPTRRHGRSS
jgi:AcrR family transcriptional regulator